jgi:hypothetical protein
LFGSCQWLYTNQQVGDFTPFLIGKINAAAYWLAKAAGKRNLCCKLDDFTHYAFIISFKLMPTMTLLIEMHSQFKMIEVTHLDNQQCAEERISQLDKISFWLKLKVILQWKSIPSLSFIAAVSFP